MLCKSCNKCQTCCPKSSCRGEAPTLLANLVETGCRSESSSNSQRGLHPPLSAPTKTSKVSHRRKQLCRSPQEQLPVGGIAATARQKCHRTSTKPNLTGVLQPTIFSPKAQQPVETYLGSEQTKPLSEDRKVQNGDSGNHQNLPPTGRMGHLHRLQGRLFPYPHTGTIQEISEVSCPGADIPIQGIAFRSIHCTHGVHCSSQGGEADGHTKGYKNPPVPR